jgi:hypothetical protein
MDGKRLQGGRQRFVTKLGASGAIDPCFWSNSEPIEAIEKSNNLNALNDAIG